MTPAQSPPSALKLQSTATRHMLCQLTGRSQAACDIADHISPTLKPSDKSNITAETNMMVPVQALCNRSLVLGCHANNCKAKRAISTRFSAWMQTTTLVRECAADVPPSSLPLLRIPGSPEGRNAMQLLEHSSLQTPDAGLDARAAHAAENGQDWRVTHCSKRLVTHASRRQSPWC